MAAASILAKVVRDREMRELSDHYPNWSFDSNKGYPCPDHKAALQGYGPSAIHRRTWIFMDHYVPWTGVDAGLPPRAADAVLTRIPDLSASDDATGNLKQTELGGWASQSS